MVETKKENKMTDGDSLLKCFFRRMSYFGKLIKMSESNCAQDAMSRTRNEEGARLNVCPKMLMGLIGCM